MRFCTQSCKKESKINKLCALVILLLSGVYICSADVTTDTTNDKNRIKKILFFDTIANDDKVSLRANTSFASMPFWEDTNTKLKTYDFNGNFFLGARYQKVTMGVESSFVYTMHQNTASNPDDILGGFFMLRCNSTIMYEQFFWLEFRSGIGASWLASAFDKNSQGTILQNRIGFSLSTAVSLKPIRFVSFDIPVFLDMYFDDGKTYPFYTVTGKLKLHPYIEWINIFGECGVQGWVYKDEYNSYNATSFIWRVGGGVELDLNRNINNFRSLRKQIKDRTLFKAGEENILQKRLRELRYAQNSKRIVFNSILFEADSEKLRPESFYTLDEIAKILVERKNLYIEIGGYTNATGSDEKELILSVKRAQSVVLYLNKKGVSLKNMKVAGYGSSAFSSKESEITENNRKVVIQILKVIRD